ncbi:restriction endonuclease [Luteimonas sp. MC1782]|uniref:restriction endonuclease n=1 Tax=Luteimonas sp. MC1782 TaxID=2760305 RepID=UPI001602C6F9|nr:restriction endonuclease [Luteimonas sp. MC1782]MBB1471655.1 restriction endonuclease [Luteimonas sp. MC1782]
MAFGLKRVAVRSRDALAAEPWDRVERLLADYYSREGYEVDHCGTGGRASRFDGGVDLRLRRDGERVVVQCKHWNAYKVPHNDVHQLLGIMVNEQATAAILVTSGGFTKAAIEAASRHGHVQLIDGDELRDMLGPLPSNAGPIDSGRSGSADSCWREPAGAFGRYAAERLVAAAEDRLRGPQRRRSSLASDMLWTSFAIGALKLIVALALLWFMASQFQRIFENLAPSLQPTASATGRPTVQRLQPEAAQSRAVPGASSAPPPPVIHEVSPAETERWRQRNAESMRILERSTPELPHDPRRRPVH